MTITPLQEAPVRLKWPLVGSLLLTAVTVTFVCERPATWMHSWGQLLSRATLYLLAAAVVHALAVWTVCRIQSDDEPAPRPRILQAILTAWVAIVWLPLIALLTSEHSPWIAAVLPVTAVFAMLLLRGQSASAADYTDADATLAEAAPLFYLDRSQPSLLLLLPAVMTAVALQMAMALLALRHDWTAGCLLGMATIYPLRRWLDQSVSASHGLHARPWRKTSASNSLLVWLLLVLALVPFLAGFARSLLGELVGAQLYAAPHIASPVLSKRSSSGYSGIVLLAPRKPREIDVAAETIPDTTSTKKPHEIVFDGAYWFFKEPQFRPEHNAKIVQGDPIRNHIFSTDHEPLIMEAHQRLGRPIDLGCCRSLRVKVMNADNVSGTISVEVLVNDTASRQGVATSLGTVVLASSAVSPMPLTRPPVEDSVVFPLPKRILQSTHNRNINEITVRIKPDRMRSRAGAKIVIESFVLQP